MFLKVLVEIALVILKGMVVMSVAVLPTVAQVAAPAVQPVAQVAPVPQEAVVAETAPIAQAAPAAQPVAELAVDPALVVISPDGLPDGVVGMPYSQTMARAIRVTRSRSLLAPVQTWLKTSSSATRPPSREVMSSESSSLVTRYLS